MTEKKKKRLISEVYGQGGRGECGGGGDEKSKQMRKEKRKLKC